MTTPTDKTRATYRSTWIQLDSVCYSDQEATNSCSWTQTKKAKDPGGFHLCIFNRDTMDFLLWYTWNLRPRGGFQEPKNSLNTPLDIQLGCEGCDSFAGQTLQQNYGASWWGWQPMSQDLFREWAWLVDQLLQKQKYRKSYICQRLLVPLICLWSWEWRNWDSTQVQQDF